MTTIAINHITKIEGHASLEIETDGNIVKKCNLKAQEGARFFEGIVLGRKYDEIVEITSRICGICSVAHTTTCQKAIENAFNIKVTKQTETLRELITIGERIRSHATHLYFFALPDYLGFESALAMVPKYKREIEQALRLMKLGNDIVTTIGGREMHPVTTIVGGFSSIPSQQNMKDLLIRLKRAKDDANATADLFLSLNYPKFEKKSEHMSLKQIDGFPLITGTIISNELFEMDPKNYDKYIEEYLEDYATSKFAVKEGKEYMVGALPRLNNNSKLLTKDAEKLLKKSKITLPCFNPFMNNIAQVIELVHWIDTAIQTIETINLHPEDPIKPVLKPGRGIACTEAPRGLLFHDYTFDVNGNVTKANIITPTCQNLRHMEENIKAYLPTLLGQPEDKVILEIEKLIRAYDPCFSCSTHFLKVKWKKNKGVCFNGN
ncbi:MAG: Ni/Fe hydrogenase subunit alpha [Candidatus Woesearchaeota archaeon]